MVVAPDPALRSHTAAVAPRIRQYGSEVRTALVSTVVALVLGGCSGPDAPAPAGATPAATPTVIVPPVPPVPTPTPTPTGTPEQQALAWTGEVCTALVPVVSQLTQAPGIDVNAPEATRQAWLAYLGDGLATTDRARQAVAAAGPAPVAGGDAIADQIRGQLADLRFDLADAQGQIAQADPGSATGLARALVSGSRVLGALVNGAKVAGTLNRDPTLRAAYQQTPACAQLQRAGAPPPSR